MIEFAVVVVFAIGHETWLAARRRKKQRAEVRAFAAALAACARPVAVLQSERGQS